MTNKCERKTAKRYWIWRCVCVFFVPVGEEYAKGEAEDAENNDPFG